MGGRGGLTTFSDRQLAIELIEEAVVNGARRHMACKILNISMKTIKRWKENTVGDQRNGPDNPANKLCENERNKVIEVVNSDEFVDKSPQEIVPLLADRGSYLASVSSFYRIMREKKLLAHRGDTRIPRKRVLKQLMATGPNEVWSWDITYLTSDIKGRYFYLYMIMDVFSRKIVGYKVHTTESAENASILINHSYSIENILEGQVTLHSDNGSPMKGYTMLATLEKLGVAASFSRPSVSNDNAYSESLFRTLKHNPGLPARPFHTIEEASKWVDTFVTWYNCKHLHSGIKYVTPNDRHTGNDVEILINREQVFKKAQRENPHRWSKNTRNWTRDIVVYLNKKGGKNQIEIDLKNTIKLSKDAA